MKCKAMGLVLAIALLGAGRAQATQVIIDNFDVPQAKIDIPAGTLSSNVSGGLNLLGGTRGITLSITSNADPTSLSARVVVSAAASTLAFSNDSGVKSKVTIEWDGGNIPNSFPAEKMLGPDANGVDLTDGGNNNWLRFRVNGLSQPLLVTVKLLDSDGDEADNTFLKRPLNVLGGLPDIVGPISPSGTGFPGNFYHGLAPFADPNATDPARCVDGSDPTDPNVGLTCPGAHGGHPSFGGNPNITLTHIVAIQFILDTNFGTGSGELTTTIDCVDTGNKPSDTNGQTSIDFNKTIDGANFCPSAAVPEPATMLLMGTGLLGLALCGAGRQYVIARRRKE